MCLRGLSAWSTKFSPAMICKSIWDFTTAINKKAAPYEAAVLILGGNYCLITLMWDVFTLTIYTPAGS